MLTFGGTEVLRYGYTGTEYDAESKLQYNRKRYYDGVTGRFISIDPIGFAGADTNLYRYAGNNSPNFTDRGGLFVDGLRDVFDDVFGIDEDSSIGKLFRKPFKYILDRGKAAHYMHGQPQTQNRSHGENFRELGIPSDMFLFDHQKPGGGR